MGGGRQDAFLVLGTVQTALHDAGVSEKEVSQFHAEATSGDYDQLLLTCMGWVSVT